ncbi:hypothetical protein FPOA_07854 [Fusarium poae]|uniref:L-ornithine N(5)-monooxygenase [NAD(P)H] n=1 Tax=Fusarium poae TaxID=36050 RepID=A0A1B8AM05_FUSPO|nr:hypothetical protein FPOA_07854 [Fusarium poae]
MNLLKTEDEIYDVLIIGAGPCGLAISARLHEHTPAALFTDEEHRRFHWISKYGNKMPLKHVRSGKITAAKSPFQKPQYKMLVLDADGDTWMSRWNRLFKMYDISHLRSPMLWHVDPLDRDALLAHAYANDREDELIEIRNCVGKEVSKHGRKKNGQRACGRRQEARVDINVRERNDYYNPSTALFCDHCEKVAARYRLGPDIIRKEALEHLDYSEVKGVSIDGEKLFTVTSNKVRRYARTVVLAVGPANVAKIPHIPSMPDTERLPQTCHSMHITEFPDPLVKQRIAAHRQTNILVVGGGLTSAQLTDLAIRKGVTKVWHVMRGPLRIKHFDVSLDWMGKFKNAKQAQFYYADSDDERIEMIKEARGGGSITPVFHKRLKKHLAAKKLELLTETSLVDASFDAQSGTWTVQTNPPIEMPAMDYMYFATGIQTDFSSLPYLQTILQKYPIEGRGGFPCINNDLMWNDEVPLFMMGRLAALRLGPAAPNLGGAQVGAERVAWAIEDRFPRRGKDYGLPLDTSWLNIIPQTPPLRRFSPSLTRRSENDTLNFLRETLSSTFNSRFNQPIMPREGTQRVKTGCRTCKTRKIKCDETWPKCKRCTTARRVCDGYDAPPVGSLSWDLLLRAPQPRLIPVTNAREVRCLSFFHHVVAPALSGPFDGSFWTYFVARMTHAEPAARHSVLAISQLFEDYEYSKPSVDRFAIVHYNTAINLLVHGPPPSVDTVLLVCVLFICVEFLRGNRAAAITHAAHGLQLLNAAGQNSRLVGTYNQISVFPTFFVEDDIGSPTNKSGECPIYSSTSEAQYALDNLILRSLEVIRSANPYRLEKMPQRPPQKLFDAQSEIQKDVDAWGKAFNRFQCTRPTADHEDSASLALMTRNGLSNLWLRECLKQDEMCFDDYKDEFIQILAWPSTTEAPQGWFTTTKNIATIGGTTDRYYTIPAQTIQIVIPTCVQTHEPDENGYLPPGTCNAHWNYYPSFSAAAVFAVLFAILTGAHIWQAARYKKSWCWVIIMAGIWETTAFTFRAISTKHQQSIGVLLVFQIFILLSPVWVNAYAYMTLGRMVYYFIPDHSLLGMPAVTLAAIFVGLDIVSFIIQLIGGSLAGPGSPPDEQLKAIHIYMGGIGLQEFFIVIFIILCIVFQRKMHEIQLEKGIKAFIASDWGKLICALYFSLAMISVRIIYRLIEFSGGEGQGNPLVTHEIYFYILEAAPMLLALLAFNIVHPGRVMQGPLSDMPGLFSFIKDKMRGGKGKQLLDDQSDSNVEMGQRYEPTRTANTCITEPSRYG